jgi:Mg2+-importing ATPase
MVVFGLVSTVFDLLTFVVLVYVFHAGEEEFQSAWFLISLLTELAVVMVLRTHRPSWKSTPGTVLAISTVIVSVLSLALPYLGSLSGWLGLMPLPWHLMLVAIAIVAAYIAATEAAKFFFYRSKRWSAHP